MRFIGPSLPADIDPSRVVPLMLDLVRKMEQHVEIKKKARLLVVGSRCEPSDTSNYAPTASANLIRFTTAYAALTGSKLYKLDVKSAFLQSARQLLEDTPEHELIVVRMSAQIADAVGLQPGYYYASPAVYGHEKAPQTWSRYAGNKIKNNMHMDNSVDPCLFTRVLSDGFVEAIALFVDDSLANSTLLVEEMSALFPCTYQELTVDRPFIFLCMRFCKYADGSITIDLDDYVVKMLERYNMTEVKSVTTSLQPGTVFTEASDFDLVDDATKLRYQEMLGSVGFSKEFARPDTVSAYHQLSKFAHRPGVQHVDGIRHLFKYLNGARSRRLRYRPDGGGLYMYCDASYATDPDTRKSVSGVVVMLAGASVLWIGAKQPLVATSSTHAEIQAYTLGAKENQMELKYAATFRINATIPPAPTSELYSSFHTVPRMQLVPVDRVPVGEWKMPPTVMYVDSQPAIRSCVEHCITKGNRHLSIMEMYVRECVLSTKTVQLAYCPTNLMVADAMTKVLPRAPQGEHMCVMFGARSIIDMVQAP